MKKFFYLFVLIFVSLDSIGQVDSVQPAPLVVVHKDYRLDILGRKEAEINTAVTKSHERSAKGFRLMVLSTNDKELAFRIRTQLLQRFPDQKVYMWFQAPFIKLKFGNFRTRQEADVYKAQISRMMNGASIYYLPETVEVKPTDTKVPTE